MLILLSRYWQLCIKCKKHIFTTIVYGRIKIHVHIRPFEGLVPKV